MLSSDFLKSWTTLDNTLFRSSITSAYAYAYGLQCLLPTLSLLHYWNKPKVGYEMCWVSTFSTALSAASTVALSWRTKNSSYLN